jgi:hypothetical protein
MEGVASFLPSSFCSAAPSSLFLPRSPLYTASPPVGGEGDFVYACGAGFIIMLASVRFQSRLAQPFKENPFYDTVQNT